MSQERIDLLDGLDFPRLYGCNEVVPGLGHGSVESSSLMVAAATTLVIADAVSAPADAAENSQENFLQLQKENVESSSSQSNTMEQGRMRFNVPSWVLRMQQRDIFTVAASLRIAAVISKLCQNYEEIEMAVLHY